MEDVKVLVLTIWPKTIMNSSPHFAIMAAIILLPNGAQRDLQGF